MTRTVIISCVTSGKSHYLTISLSTVYNFFIQRDNNLPCVESKERTNDEIVFQTEVFYKFNDGYFSLKIHIIDRP